MNYVILYLAAIVLANLTIVWFGPAWSILNAFLFIGLDLTARDALHEQWRGKHLARNMALLIAAGSLLSWLLNRDAGRIALASFLAFAAAAAVDSVAYHALRDRRPLVKINGSNVLSAAVDSIIFPLVAFGWPPLVWVMLGQFAAKVIGGAFWSLILTGRRGNRIDVIRTGYVCSSSNRFKASIGFGQYSLGIQAEAWGVRVLLIWRHVCIHLKEYADVE